VDELKVGETIIYSIIESCRRHGIEPYTYLRDVLTRLATMTNRQIKDIVPKAWAAAIKHCTQSSLKHCKCRNSNGLLPDRVVFFQQVLKNIFSWRRISDLQKVG
jgi:hypothetical protein